MGKTKHLSEVRSFFHKSPTATSRDVRLIVRKDGYARLLVSNMVRQGKAHRLIKGFYSIHNDPTLSVFYFKPAYIGLEEALSIHGLWEQETNTVIVTSRKVRIGLRRILGQNAVVHRIGRKYMFGFELMKYGDFYVPVSDVEKTFIDIVYFNLKLGKDVTDGIKKTIDRNKLENYLKPYSKLVKNRVIQAMAV